MALDVIDEQGPPKHIELERTSPEARWSLRQLARDADLFRIPHAPPDAVGYIHFNEFLDPASIIPRFEAALKGFAKAPGVILDLRGNPGGIGIMAMGIAGFFIDKDGLKLGEMKMRETTLNSSSSRAPKRTPDPWRS